MVHRIFVLFIIFVLHVANSALAGNMFTVDESISSASTKERERALSAAMETVLIRVTGKRDIAQNATVQPMMDNPKPYVRRFSYSGSNKLTVEFSSRKIEKGLTQQKVPYWNINRPNVMLFLVLEKSGKRTLVSSSRVRRINQRIDSAAAERGLPLVLPSEDDLRDANISISDIRGGFTETLSKFAAKQGVNRIAVVTLDYSRKGTVQPARWRLVSNGYTNEWSSSSADSLVSALSMGVNWISDQQMSNALSTQVVEQQLYSVLVSGIKTLKQYAASKQLLEKNTKVAQAGVMRIVAQQPVFGVAYQGSVDDLKRWLERSSRVQVNASAPVMTSNSGAIESPQADIYLEWVAP